MSAGRTVNSVIANSTELAIVRFCAEEVERQRRGPLQVAWMYEAWTDARETEEKSHAANWRLAGSGALPFTFADVRRWAYLIEREKNRLESWRTGFVRVGDHLPPHPQDIGVRMNRWSELLPEMTANEAYIEFEMIHPFIDGNGRTGKIVFNWLNGTLAAPVLPKVPTTWGIP